MADNMEGQVAKEEDKIDIDSPSASDSVSTHSSEVPEGDLKT